MTRIYGRVHIQGSGVPATGQIIFEPIELMYMDTNRVLYMRTVFTQDLDEGSFDIDVAPGDYFLRLAGNTREIRIPFVNQITLKEILSKT